MLHDLVRENAVRVKVALEDQKILWIVSITTSGIHEAVAAGFILSMSDANRAAEK
jgi:hypothetical protein